MVLTHLAFVGSRVALSLFALMLNASPAAVGVLMSLLAVIPMLMSVHTGRWTDRSGPAVPTFVALITMTAGTLVPWIFQSINGLYVASVLLGSGFMVGHIAINNAVGHASTTETRARNFGLLALGFSTSSVLGPVITGFAIDRLGHVRAFAVLAAFPALALALWPMLRRATRDHQRRVAPPANAHVFDLLRIAPLRAVFIVSGLLSVGWDLFTFMVPLYGARLGLSASTIGLIMGAFGFATFVVRVAMPWIARTFSEWQALTGALAITTGVYILFPLASMVSILLTLAFILGLGLGVGQPMVMSLIHTASPAGRAGEAVGVRTTVMNASHTFLPLGFGALGSALGMIPVFWAIAACMAVGVAFAGRRRGTVV